LIAYLLTELNGESVYNILKTKGADESTKILAEKVFDLHKTDYGIFVRITNKENTEWVELIKPKSVISKDTNFILERIKIDENKYINVMLIKKAK